jgi:putative sterol carrier protein
MSDPTATFFGEVGRRGHERLLEGVTGTIRFDLESDHRTDHWYLAISHGDVQVLREERPADAVVRADRLLFDRVASGEASPYTAWVRNELSIEGDLVLARLFQRILPGPPGARHPRTLVGARRQQP